jgi:nicotinate-nucleotide adenylyltransferase
MGNRFPEAELFLLIGGDVAPVLNTWVEAETVRQRATIVVMDRPGYHQAMPPEGWDFQRLVAVTPDIAGTEVRLRGQVGHDLTAMVPLAVADYIKKYGLYSGESCS